MLTWCNKLLSHSHIWCYPEKKKKMARKGRDPSLTDSLNSV